MVITVVYKYDVPQLILQAYSLKQNWLGVKHWNIVVDGDDLFEFIETTISEIMTGWKLKFTLVKYPASNGWHRQQIAKLKAASESNSEYCLILDAKNFLIKPASISTFTADGIWFLKTTRDEFYDTYGPLSSETLGMPFPKETPACVTPWVWHTETVKELLNRLPDYEDWETVPGTEFFLYWIFAYDKFKWVDKGLVTGFWAGPTYINDTIESSKIVHDIQNCYWWVHHRGHRCPITREVTKLVLKDIISDIAVFRRWEELSDRLYAEAPWIFDCYT